LTPNLLAQLSHVDLRKGLVKKRERKREKERERESISEFVKL